MYNGTFTRLRSSTSDPVSITRMGGSTIKFNIFIPEAAYQWNLNVVFSSPIQFRRELVALLVTVSLKESVLDFYCG